MWAAEHMGFETRCTHTQNMEDDGDPGQNLDMYPLCTRVIGKVLSMAS